MHAERGPDAREPPAAARDAGGEVAVLQPAVQHQPLVEAQRADGRAAKRHVAAIGRDALFDALVSGGSGARQNLAR